MSLPRNKFREVVFQVLFSLEFSDSIEKELLPFFMQQFRIAKSALREAIDKAENIRCFFPQIDSQIKKYSIDYPLERIAPIEKNIIRLGIYELQFDEDIPPKVAISEALRMSRKYGSPEGSKFVNAILDEVFRAKQNA